MGLLSTEEKAGVMPKSKADASAPAQTPILDAADVPNWQRQSIERSLKGARQRAHARSDRFVVAALKLLAEGEGTDFTVQDVVDRSDMSIRTFYSYFDGKDSLLLAVYETMMTKNVVPMLRERAGDESDPVLRLKNVVVALFDLTARDKQVARGLSSFYYHLAEARPQDLAHALEPLHQYLSDLLADIDRQGGLRNDVGPAALTTLLQDMLLASAHSAAFAGRPSVSSEELWAFCAGAVLVPGTSVTRQSTTGSRRTSRSA
jgi:AcrR family transcriptional regulator